MNHKLLPERRLSGPMPWVIAIMMLLTALAAASGLGLHQAGLHLRASVAGRMTVQIVEADPAERDRQAAAAMRELNRLAGIRRIERVDQKHLEALLEPWLGDGLSRANVPVPAMIDVDLAPEAQGRIAAIGAALREVAPSARVDDHGRSLAPLGRLVGSLQWLAVALIVLMGAATAFTVVLAARAALDTHHETIGVMHLLGATDGQIARLFQRRIAIDALAGGVIGLCAALGVIVLLGRRIESLGSDLVGTVNLPPEQWLLLLILPFAGTALAMATARLTIIRALRREL